MANLGSSTKAAPRADATFLARCVELTDPHANAINPTPAQRHSSRAFFRRECAVRQDAHMSVCCRYLSKSASLPSPRETLLRSALKGSPLLRLKGCLPSHFGPPPPCVFTQSLRNRGYIRLFAHSIAHSKKAGKKG